MRMTLGDWEELNREGRVKDFSQNGLQPLA